MFNPLHNSMNEKLLEKYLYNQSSTYENMHNFCCKRKPLHATTKSTPFTVSKDQRSTKEDAGKAMKNVYGTAVYQKAPFGLK